MSGLNWNERLTCTLLHDSEFNVIKDIECAKKFVDTPGDGQLTLGMVEALFDHCQHFDISDRVELHKYIADSIPSRKLKFYPYEVFLKYNKCFNANSIDSMLPPEQHIADTILKGNCIFTLVETDEICRYNAGVFHRGKKALSEVREQITALANNLQILGAKNVLKPYKCSIARRNEIVEKIKTHEFVSFMDFDVEENRITVENGDFMFSEVPFEEEVMQKYKWNSFGMSGKYCHSPNYLFTCPPKYTENPYKSFVKFPVRFDPVAQCTRIEAFIKQVFGAEMVQPIYEMIGYFLFPTVKYQKAFIIYGPPSSGKTTFIELIKRLIGGVNWKNMIAEIRLQDLSKRFRSTELRNKVLDIWDDLPPTRVPHSDVFRIFVTNRMVKGEVKGQTEWVGWINRIKFLFTTNDLPAMTKNAGDADWRRWVIIPCYSCFKNRGEMTKEDYENPQIFEKDPDIFKKLVLPIELSGLLNKALEGYERLVARGHFPLEWNDIDYVKGLWQMDINPVQLFVSECCEVGENYKQSYYDFIREVNAFRQEKGFKSITGTMCTQSLARINDMIKRSSNRKWYEGIKIVKHVVGDVEEEVEPSEENEKGVDGYLEKLEVESKERHRDYADPNFY